MSNIDENSFTDFKSFEKEFMKLTEKIMENCPKPLDY